MVDPLFAMRLSNSNPLLETWVGEQKIPRSLVHQPTPLSGAGISPSGPARTFGVNDE